jgi:hypothetical protein
VSRPQIVNSLALRGEVWQGSVVSLAEIKQEMKALSRDERLTLAEYLAVLNHLDEPTVREEVRSAMERMDKGHKISEEEVYAEHERLLAEGR